jgi:saccharopine dehydrogenase-like NADP-dependent oxidoreductase
MAGTVLVVGVGIQGRAAIGDLERSPGVDRVIAADLDRAAVERHLAAIGARKTEAVALDARDRRQLQGLLAGDEIGVVLALVPVAQEAAVAAATIEARRDLVTTNFATTIEPFDAEARARGVTILPEAGLDPGIDLVIVAKALSVFDRIDTLNSYGAGIPAPECRDANVLGYKISWSWEGVLAAYWRPARVIDQRTERVVERDQIFSRAWRHTIDVEGVGTLDAFPNGDAVAVVERAGIAHTIRNAGRYTLRWPGHCDFFEKIAALGLLDDSPGANGEPSAREFLQRHLEPRLQYLPGERDMIVVRVDVAGAKNGRRCARRYELVEYRDRRTGTLAMARTVGIPASIAAQMVLSGEIRRPGVASPLTDIPPDRFFAALAERGIRIDEREIDPAECDGAAIADCRRAALQGCLGEPM